MSRSFAAATFLNPPTEFRPWPLFVLNDEFDSDGSLQRITECLENMKRVGFGGIFIHPRPGLITEYLSPRWFEVVRHTVQECIRLGLNPGLYDENTYPSGFAGGHVAAQAPETTVRFLTPRFGMMPMPPPDGAVALYRMEDGLPAGLVTVAELEPGEAWCGFVMDYMRPLAWHGDFPYTSLLHPRTTEVFLETTYERYHRELTGAGWESCPAFFTDEPHLPAECHGPGGQGIHFSTLLASEFRRRRGYGIEGLVADLYYDSPTSSQTRFDFYETTHELWVENFARPIHHWCEQHGIAFTGHYQEDNWPCPFSTPAHVHMLAQMDWPGTDLLECFLLAGHEFGDAQNFEPVGPGMEPHALYYLKQVQSLGHQLGKKRVMNESWGAGGHDSTPLDWLRIGRYLAVHGVNLFVPHYTAITIRGARKKDHPQFFSEQSPWFDSLGPLNDELARLCWMNLNGVSQSRILLLDPLTTGYCVGAKLDCVISATDPELLADPRKMLTQTQRAFRPLRAATEDFAQALSDAQADFDIGDEYVLEENATVNGEILAIGIQKYSLLVLPPGLENLRTATLNLLRNFSASGGKIVALRPLNALLDGVSADWPAQLEVEWCDSPETLQRAVLSHVPPRIRFHEKLPTGVAHNRVESPDGCFYLIVNSSPETIESSMEILGKGFTYLLNPKDGSIAEFTEILTLPPTEARILWIARQPFGEATSPQRVISDSRIGVALELIDVTILQENVLVVDTCELEVGEEIFPDQLVYESNRLFWQRHGMETNGWASIIQFRNAILEANKRMDPQSGGTARYTVRIEKGVLLETIDLAFECPDQWALSVNGTAVATADLSSWLDWRIERICIGNLLRVGENVIELTARPFDIRQEIDQIYLLGDFNVRAADPGFVLEPVSEPLGLGSWRKQGLPFYDRKVRYRFRKPATSGHLHLRGDDWHGSVLEVEHGGKAISSYGPDLHLFLETADEEVSIIVTGLPLNLLGPWHKPNFVAKRGWSDFWDGGDVPNLPQPGSEYQLMDLGLFHAPSFDPAR